MAQGKIKWQGFVTCNLGQADKVELQRRIAEPKLEQYLLEIQAVLDDGFAFSLKPPTEKTQSYAASFRGIDPDSPNAGWMLTGWGSDSVSAILSLLYKHIVLLGGDYSDGVAKNEGGLDTFG